MRWLAGLMAGAFMVGVLAPGWAQTPPEAYVEGLRLAKEGKYLGSLRAFRQVAKEHPDQPGLYYNMGNVLRHLGEHADAIKAFKEAVRQDPTDADAYYNMAMTYSVMDEMMDLALVALTEVVRLRPEDGEAHYRLALGYYARQQLGLARKHLRLARKSGYPIPEALEVALKAKPMSPDSPQKGPQ